MVRRSGQRGVPVIVLGEEVIVGFDRARLEQALARMGAARPKLGARVAASRSLPGGARLPEGAYVGKVAPGSPAEAAGIRESDVIVRLAGVPVRGPEEIERVLQQLRPGETVEVVWIREGKEHRGQLRF